MMLTMESRSVKLTIISVFRFNPAYNEIGTVCKKKDKYVGIIGII